LLGLIVRFIRFIGFIRFIALSPFRQQALFDQTRAAGEKLATITGGFV
jgi:hypothetical protein